MAPRIREPQVSARIGALIIEVAAARGVNERQLMAEARFEPGWLDDADARMPLSVEERLWERAAELTNDPLFGLHAAAMRQRRRDPAREGVQNSGGKRGLMPGMQRKADFVANSPAIGDESQRSDAP